MKYYLVGNPGIDIVEPGKGTLIRESRTLLGRKWSYFYGQDENGNDCQFWGPWQTFDMVKAGRYPAAREVTEAVALYLIEELTRRRNISA